MLAFVSVPDQGYGDRLLARVAKRLVATGIDVGGVIQLNTETEPDCPCLMDLQVLSDDSVVRISQSLGRHSSGCRLDAAGLEEAVGRVGSALRAATPQLLILNKFGKQETEGRGFRPLIGQALSLGVPILTSVSAKNQDGFDIFAAGMATRLDATEIAITAWCLSHATARV